MVRGKMTAFIGGLSVGALALGLVACSSSNTPNRQDQQEQNASQFDDRTPPDVTGETEYNNYIRAQEEIYDDPSTILWCTVYPQSPNSPVFTVPIQGKLTSSSVSYYPGESVQWNSSYSWTEENQSVDGMYHGSPPPYRYGFTPGGQYVDFTDLPTFCTTALTEFQEQTLVVEYQ